MWTEQHRRTYARVGGLLARSFAALSACCRRICAGDMRRNGKATSPTSGWAAGVVLADEPEISVGGDQHEPVSREVGGNQPGVGGLPSVVVEALHLDDASRGCRDNSEFR
jgi:hypothetical protein